MEDSIKHKYFLLLAGVLYLLSPVLSRSLQPDRYSGGRSRSRAAVEARNESAIGVMLGEMRTTMNDVLFVKTERYLHSGVAYAPHQEEVISEKKQEEEPEVSEEHYGHEHEHEPLIRTPEDDFQGLVGDLLRKVKPWRDPSLPHEHTDGAELLPWYRIMTLVDPHDVRAYTVGSFWLRSRDIDQAEEFVLEGRRNNPEAFQIHLALGKIYYEKARRAESNEDTEISAKAQEYMNLSWESYQEAAELAAGQRPPEGVDEENPEWTQYMEDDARGSMRMAVMMEARFGDKDRARQKAMEYLEILGGDAPLERYVREMGV